MRQEIAEIVRQAGQIVREAGRDKGVTEKSGHQDLVTRYDSQVQRFLEDRLLALLPQAGFLGEEDLGEDVHADREWLFVVDPIDGTTNFVKEYPHCGISVGLYRNGQPEIGVIYDPYLDELFEAERGQGAFLNGKPIHVSDAPLQDAVTVMGTSPYYRQFTDVTFAMGKQLFAGSLDIRRAASAALDLCYIAAGRVDAYFECLLSPLGLRGRSPDRRRSRRRGHGPDGTASARGLQVFSGGGQRPVPQGPDADCHRLRLFSLRLTKKHLRP